MQSLVDFIALMEANDFRPVSVWMILPGGVMNAQLVTSANYIAYSQKYAEDRFGPDSPGDAASELATVKEMWSKVNRASAGSVEDERVALVINVTFMSGNATHKMPYGQVAIDHIAAWGLGERQ